MFLHLFLMAEIASGTTVHLRLGMALQDVAPLGVYVAGSFNEWNANATMLTMQEDQIYEISLELQPGEYEFKFINGNSWNDVEEVPYSCSEQKSGHFNRQITVGSEHVEVDVCFSACVPCDKLPPCKLYTCPPPMVHRLNKLDVISTLASECCETVGMFNKDVVVRSAGWSDGNSVSFWLNGKMIYSTSNRGFTVMLLTPQGEVLEPQSFDTHMDSTDLEDFLEALPSNSTILLGVSDEASSALSPRAKDLMTSCGAQQIGALTWRGSYALIGVKDGTAWAEAIAIAGDGMAVAVAVVPWQELPPEMLPWCDTKAPMLATKGEMHSSGNLEIHAPSGKCRYQVFEEESAKTCLSGAWIVVLGTSNAQLLANSLLFMMAGSEASEHIHFGKYNFHDFIIENGAISYHNVIKIDDMPVCKQNTTGAREQERRCQDLFSLELSKAPAPTAGRIRVTMVISFFWERVGSVMDVVEADVAWKEVKVGYVTQVVAWYLVCQNIKSWLCPRSELKSQTEDEVFAKFSAEMELVLQRMEASCTLSTGRAAQGFGCVVGSNSYTEARGPLLDAFLRFNARVMDAMSSRATGTFRALDFFQVGEAMPRETLAGHGSQRLHLWLWTMILGGWCPQDLASKHWRVEFQGPLCSAEDLDFAFCPRVSYGIGWHCMNSIPCTMKTLAEEVPSTTVSTVVELIPVTFRVGMVNEVSTAGVHLAGSFQSWDPSATPMNLNQDLNYEVTLYLSSGSYEFKFINGNSWDGAEQIPSFCSAGGFGNRALIVSSMPLVVETCFSACEPCSTIGTTTIPPGTVTQTDTMSTTSSTTELFLPVDGGFHRACRGSSPTDNQAHYFTVLFATSLLECKSLCGMAPSCVGIEYSSGRCEIWTQEIQATASISGFQCYKLKLSPPEPSISEYFHPVDGAEDRACRGKNAGDNHPSHYDVVSVQTLQECQEKCVEAPICVGIEYSLGRCEVWHRTAGIEASIELEGFSCQRYRSQRLLQSVSNQGFLRGKRN